MMRKLFLSGSSFFAAALVFIAQANASSFKYWILNGSYRWDTE